MKRSHLWVLNPCLLAMLSTSAWAEEQKEENIVVSASRAHRSVAEMAQTTWVIERAEIEQQVQGGQPEQTEQGSWIKQLFHRHGKAGD